MDIKHDIRNLVLRLNIISDFYNRDNSPMPKSQLERNFTNFTLELNEKFKNLRPMMEMSNETKEFEVIIDKLKSSKLNPKTVFQTSVLKEITTRLI